jgi:teichuronic acid exporter
LTNLDEKSSLKKGFVWLGFASGAAKVIDLASLVVILIVLTRDELGIATLAWTVIVILEAFNGLGVGTAIVQRAEVTRVQLNSLFWFIMGLAALMVLAAVAAAPLVAGFYESPALTAMIIVASFKLLFVGGALVPLQMLNRGLRYKEIGVVRALASLLSAGLKIGLVFGGLGAWALVIADTMYGFFILLGAFLLSPFRPEFQFKLSEIRTFVSFGFRVTISGVIYHFYRNMDYLIIGRFLGPEALGSYRVAFDVSMKAAEEVNLVVGRAAFPVFSKLAREKGRLVESFNWTSRNLALLLIPIAVLLFFAAPPLLALTSEWRAAALPVQILCWASVLRCLNLVFPQMFHAIGRPELAVYDALLSLATLVVTFSIALTVFRSSGIVGISVAWLVSYPILMSFMFLLSKIDLPFKVTSYLRELLPALAGGAIMFSLLSATKWALSSVDNAWIKAVVYGIVGLGGYSTYVKIKLRKSFGELKGVPIDGGGRTS